VSDDVTRVGTPEDLPDESLRSYAFGYEWSEPPLVEVDGWGVPAGELRMHSPCGRWRKDVVSLRNGQLLHRDYGGGTLLTPSVSMDKAVARLLWIKRVRDREAGATRLAAKQRRRKVIS
jgi:hypothetical protein